METTFFPQVFLFIFCDVVICPVISFSPTSFVSVTLLSCLRVNQPILKSYVKAVINVDD